MYELFMRCRVYMFIGSLYCREKSTYQSIKKKKKKRNSRPAVIWIPFLPLGPGFESMVALFGFVVIFLLS